MPQSTSSTSCHGEATDPSFTTNTIKTAFLYSNCINICPHGTSTAGVFNMAIRTWEHLAQPATHQKDTVYLAIENIHCHPSHRRQEEARRPLRIRRAARLHAMVHSRQSINQSSAVGHSHLMMKNPEMRWMRTYCTYIQRDQPDSPGPGWVVWRDKKTAQPHTRQRVQPWRTKRTSPTYARRGRRSWASWDVPRPSYLPVSFEGKDRLNGIPCCSSFGGREVEAKCRSVRFCPRKPSRRDVLIPT